MATILNIETSTRVCSVSLSVNGEVVQLRETHTQNSHAEQVTLFCDEVIKNHNISFNDLDAVAVSKGPGSYTGLRIGVSTAKGLCYGLGIPLISVSTLEAMALGIISETDKIEEKTLFCPMIDARRMEVYTSLFSEKMIEIEPITAKIIDDESFSDYLSKNKIIFGGDGAPKCMEMLGGNANAIFLNNFHTSATYVSKIAEDKFNRKIFEDTAYFEPYYLKDFVAGIPKVKGLRM